MRPNGSRRLAGRLLPLLLAPLLLASPARGEDRIVAVHYPPSDRPGELVYGVTYRVWIPDGVARLRGVIVHQHGCGKGACQGGATAADDLQWQALARKWDCALLGPSFEQEDGQDCRRWCDPRNGSRARFLQALGDLAAESGHPELATVPWCLWGHSGGGFWASLMMASDPDRVVAAWLRSGTAYATWEKGEIPRPELPEAAFRIPIVSNPGLKERDDERFKGAWDGGLAMVRAYRARGAPIAFAPDPRTGHECGDSRDLAIPYFDACLAARLPAPGADPTALRAVDLAGGWRAPFLGDVAVAADRFEGDPATAGWLPDKRVARAWSEYVRTGNVSDATPPPAPARVVAAPGTDGGVVLTWDAAADLESGLSQFVVERDGQVIGRVPERPLGKFGRPKFQVLSYHDTPEAPVPVPRFVDTTAGAKVGAGYRVIAINGVGTASAPSAPAREAGR